MSLLLYWDLLILKDFPKLYFNHFGKGVNHFIHQSTENSLQILSIWTIYSICWFYYADIILILGVSYHHHCQKEHPEIKIIIIMKMLQF